MKMVPYSEQCLSLHHNKQYIEYGYARIKDIQEVMEIEISTPFVNSDVLFKPNEEQPCVKYAEICKLKEMFKVKWGLSALKEDAEQARKNGYSTNNN